MKIGILQLYLFLPGCTSLKEKRGRIKPLIARLHKEFNLSVCELERQDAWQEAVIGCALINNHEVLIQQTFGKIVAFTQTFYTEIELTQEKIEIL